MPRVSTTSKRQPGGANQRDTRHENGLVGPGKPIRKQKSNGHINGHARTPESNSSTPPLPSTPPATNGYARNSVSADTVADKMVGRPVRQDSLSYSESSSDAYQNAEGPYQSHRQIDVNAAKNPAVHNDLGPALNYALTVLRSCPVGDTLAILIVLLQIPPTFLSMVHLLFATLTFVPSSNVATSGMTVTDILQGTLGTPSIPTIIGVDFIVLLIWLFLWGPLQDVALDLAQTVIALTLGGGTSGKETGPRSLLSCVAVVGLYHILRDGSVQGSGLRAIISSNLGSTDPDDPLEASSRSRSSKKHGLVRSVLAIHILTQGVVRYIRDWYVRREKEANLSSIGDPEAGKVADTNGDSITTMQTADNDSSSLAPGPPFVNTKKKKKQSVQVRIRQPLWAALASTKIVMVKEYETSHTAAESAGTNATDLNNLGSAPFNSEPDRIWITSVGSGEVSFCTSFFPTHGAESQEDDGCQAPIVDCAKPFFVKVNGTVWQPTRINAIADSEDAIGPNTRWNGEIFGLAPTSTYHCDFVSMMDKSIIFSATVRTGQSASDSSSNWLPNPQPGGRPSSPLSTLKTSIAQAGKKLDEERQRLKATRKDQRTKLTSIQKEVTNLTGKITSTGNQDDKHRQKAQQHNLHMRQAEEAAVSLASEINDLERLPFDDTSKHSKARHEIHSQRDEHKKAETDFESLKRGAKINLDALRNEVEQLEAKRDSKKARLTFLNSKHESLTDANAKGLGEAERMKRERAAKRQKQEEFRNFYSQRLKGLEIEREAGEAAIRAVNEAIVTLTQAQENYLPSPTTSSHNLNGAFGEPIPENIGISGAYPWNPAPPRLNSYSSGTYTPNPIATGPSSLISAHRTRGRSSSVLSNFSSFTQSSNEGTGPNTGAGLTKLLNWQDAREERKDSSASGSGTGSRSGSGAGSVADPKSPIVGNGKPSLR